MRPIPNGKKVKDLMGDFGISKAILYRLLHFHLKKNLSAIN